VRPGADVVIRALRFRLRHPPISPNCVPK